jgi:hypothetical protein
MSDIARAGFGACWRCPFQDENSSRKLPAMDNVTDQFDDTETTRRKMEDAQRAAADSINSLLSATAAANGAGLIAMASYLPTQELSAELLSALTFAALMFVTGLLSAGYAKLNAHHRLALVALGYRQKLQEHDFEQRFAPHVTADERTVITNANAKNKNAFLLHEHVSQEKRDRWASWSLVTFFLGFVVLAMSVIVHKVSSLPDAIDKARCVALETDMLRVKPRRSDSRALFQALDCKPQTGAPLQLPHGAS